MAPEMTPFAQKYQDKRIAILAPVAWRTPPTEYGAWETVAGNVAEGLVAKGWNVTLFATADSITRAKLHAVVPRGYEYTPELDPKVCEYLHISECFEHADEFDLIHSHYDFMALTYSRLVRPPVLTTIHGFSSDQIRPVYYKYDNVHYVSISNADRDPHLRYLATVYNGIKLDNHIFFPNRGDALLFLGRIHPDKGVHLAAEVAQRAGRKLIIAGIIQDQAYYDRQVAPLVDGEQIIYIGPVGLDGRNELFSKGYALLHLNETPERFGLVMAEANASGLPVIAFDNGSCSEVIAHGATGFLVHTIGEALDALERVEEIDRAACRRRVEQLFTLETMASGYERVYDMIFCGAKP